jgi:hypothetical protein
MRRPGHGEGVMAERTAAVLDHLAKSRPEINGAGGLLQHRRVEHLARVAIDVAGGVAGAVIVDIVDAEVG